MKTEELVIRDGTSQEDRLLPALKPGYIHVDETRFEDLMAMAFEYAELLEYRDMGNRPAGDWKAFFEADEACILASLLATNLNLIEADFLSALGQSKRQPLPLSEGDTGGNIFAALDLARKIDAWHTQLGALSSEEAMRTCEKIADIIEHMLGEEFQKLCAFLDGTDMAAAGTVIPELGEIWYGPERSSNAFEKVPPEGFENFLKSNFYSFRNAVLLLQEWAKESLSRSLKRSDHDPAMGLYISFLKLFGKVKGQFNDFTQRHTNFYYEDVLKVPRREYVSDGVHLVFSPDVPGREILVARGTEFEARLDASNEELIYTADNELRVTDAEVCSLHTLYFGRNRLSSPENRITDRRGADGVPKRFTTSAKLNRIVRKKVAANEAGRAYPLFGSYQRSKAEFQFEEADIGFAVASNVLLMKQGSRDVIITFKFQSARASEKGQGIFGKFAEGLGRILKTSPEDAFFKAFRNMFRISLTGEQGWLEVEEYFPLSRVIDAKGCESDSLKIRIHLPDSAGAIVPYSRELHGEGFDAGLPIARFYLNPDAYMYPYSLLRRLVVREITIEADVKGCTDVLVYNQLGQLKAGAQFNPFGMIPSPGDYFIVGHYEAAMKELADFEVNVEWGGLPQNTSGFEGYYRAYSMPFDNSVFKANLSVLRKRRWIPSAENEQPEMDLFESANAEEDGGYNRIEKTRRISFRGLCRFASPLKNVSEESYGYTPITKDGFFRLTLSNPPYAFGHKEFPLELSRTMTANARRKRFGIFRLFRKALPQMALPNQPYAPLVRAISVNYRAISRISLENVVSAEEEHLREKIYHLHPLGVEPLSPKSYGKAHLVPQYKADGNLFIGISATRLSGILTLFFHLCEDSRPESATKAFNISWHYLAGNKWKRLEKSRVVSDTTRGFLSSGIVTLDIPSDIKRGGTVLPGDLYWLRVSADGADIHTLCSLYDVHAQALKATWKRQPGNGDAHLGTKLPAGTIKKSKTTIAGIQEIRQIMDSFGGASPESDMQRIVRVSERLKHKNRAVTPSDYEHLILQQFPEIYKVKCFPCMSDRAKHRGEIKAGNLLIVLIPYLKESSTMNMQLMVNALLLREVRAFVSGLSSAFVKVHVRNPAYEKIQVRCKVKFKQGMHGYLANRLNQAIVDYISPWSSSGLKAEFDWRIRCNDIQSYIQELDFVEAVSGLSMLKISEGDDHLYRLADTARHGADEETMAELRPDYAWSIAIPTRQHLIEVVDDQGAREPVKTGIGKLSIGGTFILSRGSQ